MIYDSITQLVQINFDLLSVAIAVAGIGLLGAVILFNNRHSITNQTFFVFALVTIVWGISNYVEYRFTTIEATLWALRFHLLISTLHAFIFFQLAYVFPQEKVTFPKWYRFGLIPVVASTMITVLTPLVFSGITALAPAGQVTRGVPGPGIALFMIVAFGLLISSLVVLSVRMMKLSGVERRQSGTLFVGMFLTAILILTFNVILPNVFSNRSFIPLAALFIFPFVAFTAYAIYRHHLFNLKVASTALLGFMVTVFTFINVVYSTEISGIVLNIAAFIIVLLGSIKIVQDTLILQNLTEELKETNNRQEIFIHFMGHEVKGFVAKDEGAFAALLEGDFGKLSEELRPFVTRALEQSRQGAASVGNILKASNLKKGTVEYVKEPFDLKEIVMGVVEKEKPVAQQKGLAFSFESDDGPFPFVGDKREIGEHAIHNLIENAINYTPSGSIAVSLKKESGKIIFMVKDTGVGITEEDKKRLFTEGGHGKDSVRVNVHSTGYGLYIVKKILEAHGGTVRAESEGEGKGSTFIIELPEQSPDAVAKQAEKA